MAKGSSEDKIFTKEFILDIVFKLMGFFFFAGVILVMLLIGLRIGEISLNLGPLAIRFSTPEAGEKPANGKLLFSDNFSDPKSGWGQLHEANGSTGYDNGAYRILVNSTGQDGQGMDYYVGAGLTDSLPANVQIEVDASKAGGPDDNNFGVMCRYTSTNNQDSYYHFTLSSDGYAGILLFQDGNSTVLSGKQLEPSAAIKRGKASNHIRADCVGSSLTLYVNGKQAATAQDSTLVSGDAGLIAGTYTVSGTDILFDNFTIREP